MKTNELHSSISELVRQYPLSTSFWVAYSGGIDSQVLLHSLYTLLPTARLKAIHINHGWSNESVQWAEKCQQNCIQLGIHCEIININAQSGPGESPEAYARQARYAVMEKLLPKEDCLLTAHHRDDQAETLLLQLLRGAGLRGLAGMPISIPFGQGYLVRPFLRFSRAEIYQYAQKRGLNWIEDASNRNLRFNRNFVRHELLPLIHQRWLGATKSLARTAEHMAEAQRVLDELAYEDWLNVRDSTSDKLIVSRLLQLTPARQRNCLRFWLKRLHCSLPSQKQLQQLEFLLQSKPDATPKLNWRGVHVRRYRDFLYACALQKEINLPFDFPVFWDFTHNLSLPSVGILTAERKEGQGIHCKKLIENQVMIDFRRGGERFHLQGRCGSHPLKKLLQEWGVPPWQRKKIPLVYFQEELIAVVGYGINPDFVASANELGYVIRLQAE